MFVFNQSSDLSNPVLQSICLFFFFVCVKELHWKLIVILNFTMSIAMLRVEIFFIFFLNQLVWFKLFVDWKRSWDLFVKLYIKFVRFGPVLSNCETWGLIIGTSPIVEIKLHLKGWLYSGGVREVAIVCRWFMEVPMFGGQVQPRATMVTKN